MLLTANCVIQSLVICLLCTLLMANSPYCDVNETSISYEPVEKIYTVTRRPTGFFKAFKNTKTLTQKRIEQHEVIHWKLVPACCEGYKMHQQLKICEPVCLSGCPAHAKCMEPNICECRRGYVSAISSTNGSHYCEPICEHQCPTNGHCAKPNVCECKRGYRAEHDNCVAHCSSGCPHGGTCTAPEQCECAAGYSATGGTCKVLCDHGEDCATDEDTSTSTETIETAIETTGDYEGSWQDDFWDENEQFEYSASTDDTTLYASTEDTTAKQQHQIHAKCPVGWVYYQGDCRAATFSSNEFDCHIKACSQNALCQSNGTCACMEGFVWHRPAVSMLDNVGTDMQVAESVCITLEEFNQHLIKLSTTFETYDDVDGVDSDDSWIGLTIVALAVICFVGLLFLGLKYFRGERGELSIGANNKSELQCKYDKKSINESVMVL